MRRPHRTFLVVALAVLAVTTAGASGAGTWKPTITGTAQAGSTLTANVSSWSGGPTTFTYQWNRCNVSGSSCVALSGATAQTYVATATDVGSTLRVTAIPAKKQGSGTSDPTAVVAPAPAPPPAPAPAPSVSLTTSIANGAVLSGSVAWIVNANGAGVARIDFLVDGTKQWTEAYAPYYFNGDPNGKLDTTTLSNSTHTLLAIAYGSSGNELGRVSVGVTVNNATPTPTPSPVVTLTNSIANGATLSGSVSWLATASGFGIVHVDFLVDGVKKWTEQQPPYQFNGDPTGLLDTTTLANGSHTLLSIAYDSNSVELARATSTVTVSNSTSPPPPPPPPTSTSTWPKFGISDGAKIVTRSSSAQDFELQQDKSVGAQLVRFDYYSATADTVVNKALNLGLSPILNIGGTVNAPGPGTSTYANLAASAATKFKGKVKFYEIMNEPDLHGFTPDTYFPYLKAAYTAIKNVDPNAVVLHAGMWTGWNGVIAWYERMYQLGAKPYFDAANVHAYDDSTDYGSWSMWDMTWGSGGHGYYDAKNVRSVMNSYGDSAKPIVSTESGGPVPKYSEAKQAKIVTDALTDGRFAFVCIYNMMDDEVPGFGLLRTDLTQRPSWAAYHTAATGA